MITIYLAAPLKTDEQREKNTQIAWDIRRHYKSAEQPNLYIYLPQYHGILLPSATKEARRTVYQDNLLQIGKADLMVAVLDEKDTGVIYEMGYRASTKKPMVAVYMVPTPSVNVMLTEGCYAICNGRDEFLGWLENPHPTTYEGGTE